MNGIFFQPVTGVLHGLSRAVKSGLRIVNFASEKLHVLICFDINLLQRLEIPSQHNLVNQERNIGLKISTAGQ